MANDELTRMIEEEEEEHERWLATLSVADRKAYEAFMESGGSIENIESFEHFLSQLPE
jgi:hypothetical protein